MKKIFSLLFLFFSFQTFSQTYSFIYDNILRDYIVHLPISYNSSNKYPLVLNMHGYTSNAAQQEVYSQMSIVADTGNFIVVYPNGVNNAWNGGFGVNSNINDVGFLSALIDTMKKNFSIDSARVFACGMSAGGFMSYRLACELQNKIAAIASVTGLMADSVRLFCQNPCSVSIMDIHGTADPVVNYNGSLGYVSVDSTVKWWVQKNICPASPVITNFPDINVTDGSTVTKYCYGLCSDSTEVIFYKVLNGGHTWPGAVTVPSLGNTNQDIKASGEIWKFFRKHHLKCTINSNYENGSSHESLSIFPNPTSGTFNLIMNNEQGIMNNEVNIYNVYGEKVYSSIIISHSSLINLNSPNGIYILKIETENGFYAFRIIIK